MNGRTPSDATATSEEILKLDASTGLSPEETAKRRRRALLRRFWHSASRYWGRDGGKRAWLLTGGLLAIVLLNLASAYGMNVWNRAIFDALEQRDSSDVLLVSAALLPAARRQRLRRGRAGLCPHDDAAPLARLAEQPSVRPLDPGRPLLSAQPDQRRPSEPRIPHRRRRPHRHRIAGRFRHRHDRGGAVGAHLHHRAVDHRWRAHRRSSAARRSPFRAFWSSPRWSTRCSRAARWCSSAAASSPSRRTRTSPRPSTATC